MPFFGADNDIKKSYIGVDILAHICKFPAMIPQMRLSNVCNKDMEWRQNMLQFNNGLLNCLK